MVAYVQLHTSTIFLIQLSILRFTKGVLWLIKLALDSGLTCLILLPVFSSNDPRSCVGVVECCMTFSGLPQVFYLLKDALEVITFLIPLFIHSFIISNHIILILPILTYMFVLFCRELVCLRIVLKNVYNNRLCTVVSNMKSKTH